jgi:hypothetical protein
MATLETQYENYKKEHPELADVSFEDWKTIHSMKFKNFEPKISDDFQIGPDGAYEATEDNYKPEENMIINIKKYPNFETGNIVTLNDFEKSKYVNMDLSLKIGDIFNRKKGVRVY